MKYSVNGKQVIVIGLGMTGQSCVRFLQAHGAHVSAMDTRTGLDHGLDIPVHLGELNAAKLCKADLILVSPGVSIDTPVLQLAMNLGIEVFGDIELFARYNKLPVIAVTGSNGKSTVTKLAGEMCKAQGLATHVGGNIGEPVLDLLDKPADIMVLELSSFQLETVSTLAPLAATVLNVCEDHLDRHYNLENYRQVKHRIYANASHIVVNRDDVNSVASVPAHSSFGLSPSDSDWGWDKDSRSITWQGQYVVSIDDCHLNGLHNVANIQAAAALAQAAGCSLEAIRAGAMAFAGLPHRSETVSNYNGVQWINDSKATNAGATLAAIKGLGDLGPHRLLLIAGGDGKGVDFSPLQNTFNEKVSELITIGRDGPKLAALKDGSHQVASLQEAVTLADQLAQPGDIVMMSPACASFDMFKSFKHRGECFAESIRELAE